MNAARRCMVVIGCLIAATAAGAVPAKATETPKGPEPGTYEYQWAMETGNLPPGPGSTLKPSGPRKMTVADHGMWIYPFDPYTGGQGGTTKETIPILEAGGTSYRVGIDTP